MRVPPRLAGVLLVVGALGLLLPWLLAPVTSDSRYHYLAAPGRFDDSVLGVLPWTVNDMEWRLNQGRIAPAGVFAQHVVYLLGMRTAHATGAELYQVHAVVKLLLLMALIGGCWALLRAVRTAPGTRLPHPVRDLSLLLVTTLLVLGVTTTNPHRNGWLTFPVLCIGGTVLLVLSGAAVLAAVTTWGRRPRLRLPLALGLVLLGVLVVLYYELQWATYPFAVLLALGQARPHWRLWRRAPGDGSRWAVVGALSLGFLPALATSRWLVETYRDDGAYAGLETELGGPVLRTMALQVLNAVPGSGLGLTLDELPSGAAAPGPSPGGGWLFGALVAVGLVVLLRRAVARTSAAADNTDGSDASESSAASARPGAARALLHLVPAALAAILAAAVVLSVSGQAQEYVAGPGYAYRGTPWIWTGLALAATAALVAAALTRPVPFGRVVVVGPALGALLAGVVLWPFQVADVRTLRQVQDYSIFEEVHQQVVIGSDDPASREQRCLLEEQADRWADDSGYRRAYLTITQDAYERRWGEAFCRPPAPDEL